MAQSASKVYSSVQSFADVLKHAAPKPPDAASREEKKNYAERFSRHAATWIANKLRPHFPSIVPDEAGSRQEAPARTAKGFKKLDIGYSTPELGLALGVSIKSLGFPDPRTKRFTKNYSRNDNELRAEATDYHLRQPYSVLVGVLFLPLRSCEDCVAARGKEERVSSFGAAVKFFRTRTGRKTPQDSIELFERFYLGLFDEGSGLVRFFDVNTPPPRDRRPADIETMSEEQLIQEIIGAYNERNDPPFQWAE